MRIPNVQGRLVLDELLYLRGVEKERAEKHRVMAGATLLVGSNGNAKRVGNCAFVREPGEFLFASFLLAALPSSDDIVPAFLYRVIASAQVQSAISERVQGSTGLKNINLGDLRAQKALLPSREEQLKMVAILDAVDDAIAAGEAVVAQARRLHWEMMCELMASGAGSRRPLQHDHLPSGWKVMRVSELGRVVTGGTPSTSRADFWGGGVPFITPGDLGEVRVVTSTARTVTNLGLASVRAIPASAVLVTCIGTIGKVGIAGRDCCTNQQINAIICGPQVLPEYLYYRMLVMKETILAHSGTTAVPIISKGKFEQLATPVPPIAEQRRIAEVLSSIDDRIEKERAVLAERRRLKAALADALLSGRVRVPDAA